MASSLEILALAKLSFYDNKPTATLIQTSGQSIPTGTNTQVSWNSASGDVWGGWSGASPTRYTVQVAGWYKLEATIQWPGNSTGIRHTEFYQNGIENTNSLTSWGAPPGANPFPQSANPVIVQAAVGDYFQMNLWHAAGVSLTTATVNTFVIEFQHF